MDTTCYKCGAVVPDGTAFCPQCGAPQIRVNIQAPQQAVPLESPVFEPGTPAGMQPPAQPVIIAPMTPGGHVSGIDWSAARTGALIAGVLIGMASMMPFGFLWVIAGGALAVSLYHRRRKYPKLRPGEGAKVGALSGLIGYLVFAILAGIEFLAHPGKLREAVTQSIQQARMQNSDPRIQEMYQKLTSPEGMAFVVTFAMVIFLLVFILFACAGGAISAAIARRNEQR